MALINDKKQFVNAVSTIVNVDLGVESKVFPSMMFSKADTIEYDMVTVTGVAPSYNSFANTARVISKNGKDKVTLNPVNFNDSISKTVIDANKEKFGQNEYGEGNVDATTESALNGVGGIRLNHLIGKKKLIYEALTTHQIAGGYQGSNGAEDIVFAVPSANKVEFDGTTAGQLYWSNANAKPVTNLLTAYTSMIVKPSMVIMNDIDFGKFYGSSEIRTSDNTSTGTKRNFIMNENIDSESDFYLAGRLMEKGIALDIYVERGRIGGGATPYLTTGYVVMCSPKGEMHFGGIPVAEAGGIRMMSTEWDADEVITQNPPQHMVVVRTAPLPVLKNGNAFYSMKVED